MVYAFSENYILPISHDEVVHGKKSILDKMHGNVEQKFSCLRAFMLYMFSHPGKKLNFMGNEFGQFKEWAYQEGLEFFLKCYPLHNQLSNFNKELNHFYKDNPPLYQIEDSWQGFNWISADEKDNNVISYIRTDLNGEQVIAIINFSGNDYINYRLGVEKGYYRMVICSDDKKYGGRGLNKIKTIKSCSRNPAHGKRNSIRFNLPAFSGIYFKKIK
jgi:1,4-alpha-glucan branching enzyme